MLQASARGAEEQHARDPSATGIRDPFIRDAATNGQLPDLVGDPTTMGDRCSSPGRYDLSNQRPEPRRSRTLIDTG